MKVLFWVPPWAAHGDPFFYLNCVKKHLIPQANLLSSSGCSVDFVLPELMSAEKGLINSSVKVIDFSFSDQIDVFNNFSDHSLKFYKEKNNDLIEKVAEKIKIKLSKNYDVVLLWETPVPFLKIIYPDALIVHQMPGAFSRAPYPHTVTFDPIGLYKEGSTFLYAEDIKTGKSTNKKEKLADSFSMGVRNAINAIQPFEISDFSEERFSKLRLLPLQVSAHYSFLADTSYRSQSDFLMDVLRKTPEDVGLVVTQYVTPRVSDTVLTPNVFGALKSKYPNLIFKEEFDRVESVSQLILPFIDEVVSCSSSIGFQAMAWPRELLVEQKTFMQPYGDLSNKKLINFSRREIYDNTLNFLLSRNQPLARLVVEDSKFLLAILQEMISRKKSGLTGVDLMPDFNEIDPNYSERLLGSFSIERAARGISKLPDSWAEKQIDLNKFWREVTQSSVKVVTFDLFDTLVKRPTEVPADVFKFLEKEALEITSGVAEDFARVRQASEITARELSENDEISLEDIYSHIQEYYDFDAEMIHLLMQAEIELELLFIKPRPLGMKLWQMAVDTGKPIYIVSDMYLNISVIEQILDKSGYKERSGVFLSSIYGARKKEGKLFEIVVDNLKVDPGNILHVGDNKVADIEQAQAKGLKTFRLLRAIDRMRGNEFYKNLFPNKIGVGERSRSVIAGLIAGGLFDQAVGDNEKNSLFHGSSFNLGYAGLGPILSGFMLWLGREAKRDKVSKLYFLSREGWILKKVYDVLHRFDEDAVPSAYIYASRRATRVASLKSKGDVLCLAGHPFKSGVQVGELIRSRFGINPALVDKETWLEAGYTSSRDLLHSDQAGRVKFSRFCGLIFNLIEENSRKERLAYDSYLNEVGLLNDANPAVVDVGWKANMQGALGNLLNRPLKGYYYASLQGAELWLNKSHEIYSYLGSMVANGHPSAVLNNRPLFEYLTCHVEQSLVKIERNRDGFLIPVFRSEDNPGVRRMLIEQVHAGASGFAKDLIDNYRNVVDNIYIDAFLAERVFYEFASNPSSTDAALLVGHHFEDSLGGVRKQYIIKPVENNAHAESVWKAGVLAIYHTKNQSNEKKNITTTTKSIQPVIPFTKSLEKTDSHESRCSLNGNSYFHLKLERWFICKFSSPKKIAKYERDRDAFFLDSKSDFLRAWYKWQLSK